MRRRRGEGDARPAPTCSRKGGSAFAPPPPFRFALRLVQWRVDFPDLLRLPRLVRLRLVVEIGLAAEVEALEAEAVGAVGVDLLERRQQLLLGRRPRVGRDSAAPGADPDRP